MIYDVMLRICFWIMQAGGLERGEVLGADKIGLATCG